VFGPILRSTANVDPFLFWTAFRCPNNSRAMRQNREKERTSDREAGLRDERVERRGRQGVKAAVAKGTG
jgi:hypothetical protein